MIATLPGGSFVVAWAGSDLLVADSGNASIRRIPGADLATATAAVNSLAALEAEGIPAVLEPAGSKGGYHGVGEGRVETIKAVIEAERAEKKALLMKTLEDTEDDPQIRLEAARALCVVPEAARELLASVSANRWEVFWRLRLPSALSGIAGVGMVYLLVRGAAGRTRAGIAALSGSSCGSIRRAGPRRLPT